MFEAFFYAHCGRLDPHPPRQVYLAGNAAHCARVPTAARPGSCCHWRETQGFADMLSSHCSSVMPFREKLAGEMDAVLHWPCLPSIQVDVLFIDRRPADNATARSTLFSSWRMLPGQ